MTRTMYDSINPDIIPAGASMVAGYVAGTYANMDRLRARFPNATLVGIATNPRWDAQVLDVETHAATITQAPPWCERQRQAGRIPTVYTLYGWWSAARAEFTRQQVAQPQWWLAKYDNRPVMIPGTVAKQYGGVVNRYDLSIVADYWPGVDPAPQPPNDGDLMRTYKIVSMPTPDQGGRQIVGVPELAFNDVSSVVIKANDDGGPVHAIVQPFSYNGQLAVSFLNPAGGPVPSGSVGLIIEHR